MVSNHQSGIVKITWPGCGGFPQEGGYLKQFNF
jgi:hypothetical protein